MFKTGDTIKVYLAEVNSSSQGPQITVSRADAGFLKRLFEEEIHDVYDGTVIIKDIAREAGERSKVSVVSLDPNVDPVGACIGQGGQKIQKICSQINREKIDIIQHHIHPGLFIAEALKPATVLGVKILEDEANKAVAVVKDGDLRVSIGKRGVNARLAVKLTGYHIDIVEINEALEKGISFDTIEKMKDQEEQMIFEQRRAAILAEQARDEEERANKLAVENVVEEEVVENNIVEEQVVDKVVEVEQIEKVEVEEPSKEVKETKVEETKPVEEVVVEYKPKIVGERISLDELEKSIEEEKKKNNQTTKKRKTVKVEEEKVEEKKVIDTSKNMAIYTEEELAELDYEYDDEDYYDDDEEIDYTEYDKYYEE